MKNIKKFFKKLASRKSFWIVIEAFILALGSIFLIYLLQPKFIPEPIRTGIKKTIDEAILGEKDTTKTSEEQAVSDQEKSSTTKPKETIDTSNWKTYSNQEYGFSVKYPREYSIEINNERFGKGVSFYPPENKNYTDNRTTSIDIGVWNKDAGLDIASVIGFIHYKEDLIGEDEIILDENKNRGLSEDKIELAENIWRKDYFWSKTSKGNIFKQIIVATEKNNKIYAISLYSIEKEDKSLQYEKDYNELLKTFSFN